MEAHRKLNVFHWKLSENRMTFVEISTKAGSGLLSLKEYVGVPSFLQKTLTFRVAPIRRYANSCQPEVYQCILYYVYYEVEVYAMYI